MVDADHLYGADCGWWHFHIHDINMGFAGKRWSCDPMKDGIHTKSNWNTHDPDEWGIKVLGCKVGKGITGLSRDKDVVVSGGNSGYQAINLAYHLGATRIILIGMDMSWQGGKSHWFGDHPEELTNAKPDRYIAAFRTIKPADYGLEIINCSRRTALDAFPRQNLEDITWHE
jgi:hypothetical protein